MTDFLTLEDVNGAVFSNQDFWWYELDTSIIGDEDFTDVKIDFCTVSRETSGSNYIYTIVVDNDRWTYGYAISGISATMSVNLPLQITTNASTIKVLLYMGGLKFESLRIIDWYLKDEDYKMSLNLKELNTSHTFTMYGRGIGNRVSVTKDLEVGYNLIDSPTILSDRIAGYVYVTLQKTDFQFNCTQTLLVGKVNQVALGTDTDYLPDGDMIGDNTPKITVQYGNEIIPVRWNNSLNDYTFQLDLSDRNDEEKIKFRVIVEANDVINTSETTVLLDSTYEEINTLSKLTKLSRNGGVGRLTGNIGLNADLVVGKDVYLITTDKTINMNGYKIIVSSNKSFKAENVKFTNGENTIQQQPQSRVELVGCTFNNCTGIGSVIECLIDIESLEDTSDFNTILDGCTVKNCDVAILHDGQLTVTGCTVTGRIGNPSFPYFLYQTDGEAEITRSTFKLSSNSQITHDVKFNSCIFVCGENATVNGLGHSELQKNGIDFAGNTSTIDITYWYGLITEYINLKSTDGFCHGVSGVDYVFKNNVTVRRVN